MEFEWDEEKNRINLTKHGISFEDAALILKGPIFVQRSRYPHEERWLATGELAGRVFTIVYTMRGTTLRIISARRARTNEKRAYRSLLAKGA